MIYGFIVQDEFFPVELNKEVVERYEMNNIPQMMVLQRPARHENASVNRYKTCSSAFVTPITEENLLTYVEHLI